MSESFSGSALRLVRRFSALFTPKTLDRFKGQMREITRRAEGVSIETTIANWLPAAVKKHRADDEQGRRVTSCRSNASVFTWGV